MREIWKLLLFRTLWFVIQLSFKIFQALTSFALLYQYTDPSGKFGKHSKTFRDHVNFPVAITKQHNWQPISYVAQTKHTNFIFSRVNPNALKTRQSAPTQLLQLQIPVRSFLMLKRRKVSAKFYATYLTRIFFEQKKFSTYHVNFELFPAHWWVKNFKDQKKIANNFFKRLLQYVSIISLLLSEALEPLLFGEERT